jgi:hypothetical protein
MLWTKIQLMLFNSVVYFAEAGSREPAFLGNNVPADKREYGDDSKDDGRVCVL